MLLIENERLLPAPEEGSIRWEAVRRAIEVRNQGVEITNSDPLTASLQ